MKTNSRKAMHSSFCTMGVSPTATSGGRETSRSDLHFYSFFVHPHSKKLFTKQRTPQSTGGLTGLGSLRGLNTTQIPIQLGAGAQFHHTQRGGDELFPASNHVSKCDSFLLNCPPKHSQFSHSRQPACASIANQFLGCLQNSFLQMYKMP